MLSIVVRSLLALAATSLLLGCGGGAEGGKQVPVYKVTGKVTMAGAPLAGVSVSFSPKESQPVAVGTTNATGEFTLTTYTSGDGAAAGEYAVVLSKSKAVEVKPDAGHSTDPAEIAKIEEGHSEAAAKSSENLVPELYMDATKTPLSAKVEAKGDNKFDFEIK